jgi:hypothetical protein
MKTPDSLMGSHQGHCIAYTCCTCNFSGQANTLGQSLGKTNKEIEFVVFFIDKPAGVSADRLTPFTSYFLPDIGGDSYDELTGRYNAFELSCAAKTLAGRMLMAIRPESECYFYFDADICVYGDLKPGIEALRDRAIAITPHTRKPLPNDGYSPDDRTFLRRGLFNAGFFAFRQIDATQRIFDWLDDRLRTMCSDQALTGVYVDQKWFDLLPIYFASDTAILEHRGFNAGYWNLHENVISRSGNTWVVGGHDPLIFFHFSGYDPEISDSISRLQNRHSFALLPHLKPLFDEYGSALRINHVHENTILPYGYKNRLKQARKAKPWSKRLLRAIAWQLIVRGKIDL